MATIRGKILSGTQYARDIKLDLKTRIDQLKLTYKEFSPKLAIVQVGGREDSNVYIRMKIQAANSVGVLAEHVKLPKNITQNELLERIEKMNFDTTIHGIIVQMPLDCENPIDSNLITDSVSPAKDVDGLHTINEGKLAIGEFNSAFLPCTPHGVLELIKKSQITIEGSDAVVLGRSKIVGTPVAELLKWHHATVTICHSKTKNLKEKCQNADILVVAIGRPEFVKKDWIKSGAVVIDCGINSICDSSKPSGKKLVGDVDYEEVKEIASFITPVPGGVGPMTVAMLIKNTVIGAEKSLRQVKNLWNLKPLTLNLLSPVPSDIEIARAQTPKDITVLAEEIGLLPTEISQYGTKMAKVSLSVLDRLKNAPNGKYVVVTAITPTPFGEGKSTTMIGLAQAFSTRLKRNTVNTMRQPSQGPTFGIKGGAAGGGYSQVIPMEQMNLHLTGDIHAIGAANNLLAAQLDTRIFHEATQTDQALYDRLVPKTKDGRKFSKIQLRRINRLGIEKTNPDDLTNTERARFARLDIDPTQVIWQRCLDVNDRYLRAVTVGESATEKGLSRKTGFQITVASEIMAILALAKTIVDFKERLAKMVVAFDRQGAPVTADDLGVTGALLVLLKDALQPTLIQTLEGSPCLVHAGPFANIAHGANSILADKIALKLVGKEGVVITEAGFASDIGMEKFFNIKCRASDDRPDAVVLVATIRALKMHGGGAPVQPGTRLSEEYITENLPLLRAGLPNVIKHISNANKYGIPVIVAINHYMNDSPKEIELLQDSLKSAGAFDVVLTKNWELGGLGAEQLARSVSKSLEPTTLNNNNFKFLYELNQPLKKKIEIIAKEMYGAGGVTYSSLAEEKLQKYEEQGFGNLPICMAKTQLSLTGDPTIKGAPTGFILTIKDVSASIGAGFIIPLTGEITKIPGLPTHPAIYDIDLNLETGEIEGLF